MMSDNGRVDRNGTSVGAEETDTVRALLHDLREPLAAILLLSASSTGDVGRKLNLIQDQASWLSELVDSGLDDAATDRVDLVDTREIADQVAARCRTTATTSITVESAGSVLAVARPVALARALACVLDNAVRAAGPDGHVTITARDCGDAVHLTVVDDGPGLGRVTHRTSLGLTTTRAMVVACRGRFLLDAGPNGGAMADISLRPGRNFLAAS